jgi:hypothetical protein
VTSFSTQLQAAREALADAIHSDVQRTRKQRAGDFMVAIGRIGRALGPALVAERASWPPEIAMFADETAPSLRSADGALGLWLGDATAYKAEDDASYQSWLLDRSAIEMLRTIYRGTAAEHFTAEFDTEEFDELLRYKAPFFNAGERPAGIPDSHWWWNEG